MPPTRVLAALLAVAGAVACEGPTEVRATDSALVDLSLREVSPTTWIPGTSIAVQGDAFVDDPWGSSRLRLRGTSSRAGEIDVAVPLRFASFERLEATADASIIDALGGTAAHWDGTAVVEVISAVDGSTYTSSPLDLSLVVDDLLTPQLHAVQDAGIIFPNEKIDVEGSDFLLEGEGETVAVVEGCFAAMGIESCDPIQAVEIPVVVEIDRDVGYFAFAPPIVGIEPGHFEGQVSLRNQHQSGDVAASTALPCSYDLTEPILYGVSTDRATVGQFVDIEGGGFVGGGQGDTLLNFLGTFTADATGIPDDMDVVLVPEFVDGEMVRYVVSESDAIGEQLDVRFDTGVFQGTITPTIAWENQEESGDPVPLSFTLLAVKQVVYIEFLPSYTESLRHFGLRAVDQMIRERVFAVIERDFATLNLELRDALPTDYAQFAQVDVAGPDPNGLGLLGYDNTPGKDTDNRRLYDRIGGVNALTQEDGFPGYGGVFIESLLGYSEDPAGFAQRIEPNATFDATFDPFRIERGGTPVVASDLAAGLVTLNSGDSCPAGEDRRLQIACAIWTLGNVVGSTVSHEIGHSVGLSDPYGPAFHNTGDAANRLMDSDRPFEERANVQGQGPSRFCADEYDYLRAILPTDDPYDPTARPSCF